MPDPLADAVSGSLSPFVSSLDTINTVLRSARQTRQSARGALLGGQQFGTPEPQTLVWIRNDTGSALSAFSVVALGTPVISAVDYPHTVRQYPVFPATAPAATTDCFAILGEPAEAYTTGTDGRPGIARAAILGVMPCDISVSNTTHTHATPTAGVTGYMTSATHGAARIIWKESGTGTKRAVVLLTGDDAYQPATTSLTSTGTYAVTADSTFEDTGFSITLADAGTYLLQYQVLFVSYMTAFLGGYVGYCQAKLRNSTTSADVTGSGCCQIATSVVNRSGYTTLSASVIYTTTSSSNVIKLYGYRSAGGTWTQSQFQYINDECKTVINAIKLT